MGTSEDSEELDLLNFLSYWTSILTIMACFVLKTPQILNLYNKKSAEGININALLMELASYSITAVYNFVNGYSLLTYLEYPIILLQQGLLIFLFLKYKGWLNEPSVRVGAMWYILFVCAFMAKALPPRILTYLVPLTTPVSGMSKCVYMYAIIQAENADNTSLLTWVISISTNISRIFTVYLDSGDRNLLFNFTLSSLLSTGVLVTAVYYQRRSRQALQDGRRRDD